VLAGPNGSGKSTLAAKLEVEGHGLGKMINPDEIAVELREAGFKGNVEFEAGREALRRTKANIKSKVSFTRETTLSSTEILLLRTMKAAKNAGFEVNLIFVAVSSLAINKGRVADRAAQGGHDIPLDVQNRRFGKTFENAVKAINIAHSAQIFDNTGMQHVLVGLVKHQKVTLASPDKAPWITRILKGVERKEIISISDAKSKLQDISAFAKAEFMEDFDNASKWGRKNEAKVASKRLESLELTPKMLDKLKTEGVKSLAVTRPDNPSASSKALSIIRAGAEVYKKLGLGRDKTDKTRGR